MKLDDFNFCGFSSFSRIFIVRDLAEARKVNRFLGCDDYFKEAFETYGPGKYYVRLQEGWDRGGDYSIRDVTFIPEEVLTWEETAKQIKSLKKTVDTLNEPFIIAERLQRDARAKGLSYDEAVKTLLTPKEQKAYASMDCNAHEEARSMFDNFLNGFGFERDE
jgi:hypothetical protein